LGGRDQENLGLKLARTKKLVGTPSQQNKPGVMKHVYNPSYAGDIDRIAIQARVRKESGHKYCIRFPVTMPNVTTYATKIVFQLSGRSVSSKS
jgi:hypothetical protein